MKMDITCVIPAHNEGEGICSTILEIDSNVPENVNFTIFVSEDGSSDNTRSEVAAAARLAKNSKVVLSTPANRLGYSRAVQRGITECETDFVLFMDADGQCDPSDIKILVENFPETGLIVGFRNPRADGLNRKLYSKLFGVVYRALGGPKLIDPSSPFILARLADVIDFGTVDCHLSFGFWWEFQWRVAQKKLLVIQEPVSHRVRTAGETQVYTLKKLPKIIRTHIIGLWRLRRELRSLI